MKNEINEVVEQLILKLKEEAQRSFTDEAMRKSYVSGALLFWEKKILENCGNLQPIKNQMLQRING